MKILLAPSETKTPNGNNKFEINSLIFSKLYFLQDSSEVTALALPKAGAETPVPSQLDRKIIFDRYIDIIKNGDKDTLSKMFGLKKEIDINFYKDEIRTQKGKKAIERYSGVAFDYLDYPNLNSDVQKYIDKNVLIFSNLFGIIRADDMIPNYKLKQAELVDNIKVDKFYKENLKEVLDDYLKDEDILNLSANYYDKFYKPCKNYTTLKFLKNNKVVSHWAKAYRGLVLKAIAEANISTIDEFIKLSIDGLSLKEIKTIKNKTEIIYDIYVE